jgi:3-methyladenine DNA glycosylase AlkD
MNNRRQTFAKGVVMTITDIMKELEALGNEQTKKTYLRHGAPEPLYGVKMADLKKLQKKIKKNHDLALGLYNTGNSDAMYLAGLIADEKKMTEKDLENWAQKATWHMISEYTVAQLAAESEAGYELALGWINSSRENVASSGWAALANLMSIIPDDELDIDALGGLLERIATTIHDAPNRVRYTMNSFVIAAGTAIPALTEKAKAVAETIGLIKVNMGDTACKVPPAGPSIVKVEEKGLIGKKRKDARG